MHKTSIKYMRQSFRRHTRDRAPGKVLDVGAVGGRAWFREIWEAGGWTYHGMDLGAGNNVDIVLEDPWKFPLEDHSYDAVISGQMLEHNEFFWLSFLEMNRVLKPGGLMIHIAPSRGPEHRDPQDCWRFYRDGMAALGKWSGFELVDSSTDWAPEHFEYAESRGKLRRHIPRLKKTMRTLGGVWGDTVGVFVKTADPAETVALDYMRHFTAMHPEAAAATPLAAE